MAIDTKHKAVRALRLPTTNYNGSPIQITPAQQGDLNSRIFKVQLYDDYGNIDLALYTTALLSATRADEELLIAEGEIADGFIYCMLTAPMLAEIGKVTCDITLTGKDTNGKDLILTSQTFYVYVARSQLVENLKSSENYNILVSLISDVREIERGLRLFKAGIHEVESTRLLAENDRVSNEKTRQSNEAVRQETFQSLATDVSNAIDTALSIATAATGAAAEAVKLSADALEVSAQAELIADNAQSIAKDANITAQTAMEKAESVVERANNGEFKGEKGDSGFVLSISNSFFRVEVRDDGNLWVISPEDNPNQFSIKDGNLILTIS